MQFVIVVVNLENRFHEQAGCWIESIIPLSRKISIFQLLCFSVLVGLDISRMW